MKHRYDFIYLFDAIDANPNGDPDAGNLPRTDAETGHGLVTDVCIKRKIRNFVTLTKELQSPYGIYVQEGSVLGRKHTEAFKELNIDLGQDSKAKISEEQAGIYDASGLPDGVKTEEDEDDQFWLVVEGATDKVEVKAWLKDSGLDGPCKAILTKLLKEAKGRKPKKEETEAGKEVMCKHYFDVRAFGAVMSLKSAPNCGQVRGPVQMSFARSIDPIVTMEHSITRCAVATEAESIKQDGGNRTMGRKFTVPYALYRSHGFVNPYLAERELANGKKDGTLFSEGTHLGEKKATEDTSDLELLFNSLENAFQFDQSAARPSGSMNARGLLIFRHDTPLGSCASHKLFDAVKIHRIDQEKPARSIDDYRITIFGLPMEDFGDVVDLAKHGFNGVTLIRRI
jgi:CRISPR-associated protein Csd2